MLGKLQQARGGGRLRRQGEGSRVRQGVGCGGKNNDRKIRSVPQPGINRDSGRGFADNVLQAPGLQMGSSSRGESHKSAGAQRRRQNPGLRLMPPLPCVLYFFHRCLTYIPR